MTPYKNLGGDSGVEAYENSSESIRVKFTTGAIYTYTYSSAGSSVIEEMKRLAERGEGLNSYISRNKPGFSSKC